VTRRLDPGDTIVLYSDGLLEARSADGEEFGIERIASAVRCGSRDRIIERVLADAKGHAFDDDVTLMTITAS
jgi:serine phosphatase RsbU (regulator of sigma subunit)